MTIEELQKEVGKWHRKEFGACSDKRLARKALEESAEFLCASKSEHMPMLEMRDEAADLMIVLMAWADRHGVNLVNAASFKFDQVKQRDQFKRDTDNGLVEE